MSDSPSLQSLVPRLRQHPGIQAILESLRQGNSGTVDGAWGSSCALTTACVATSTSGPVIAILPRARDIEDFAGDLTSFLGQPPLVFPAWESLPSEQSTSDPIHGERLRLLKQLESEAPPQLVLTSIAATLQPVPARQSRQKSMRRFRVGDELPLESTSEWLISLGFERVLSIETRGEFSIHGGIVDLWTADLEHPIRIELFGDEIESIRTFDVESQRKLADLNEIEVSVLDLRRLPQEEMPTSLDDPFPTEHFSGSWPKNTVVVLVDHADIRHEAQAYLERLGDRRGMFSSESSLQKMLQFPSLNIAPLLADGFDTTCHLQVESVERLTGPKTEALRELCTILQPDEHVLLACHNAAAIERMQELLDGLEEAQKPRIRLCEGTITRGFRLTWERLVVLSDHELFGRVEVRRTATRSRLETRAIDSFLDLNEGDLVVHLSHGIGRFLGMQILAKGDQSEEHMHLEFKDGAKLFVPVALIHLVQKYVGGQKTAPELSKLGGTAWAQKKKRVAEAVTDMAADMLRLQAERELQPGIAFPPDSHWMEEFEASFPYIETIDQSKAILDIKRDMERPRPMERLICGDVGFGKTEVAMRAAFKAVDGGKQVAVLVPTTVLAEQHYRSFSSRFAEFPINIGQLSRFRTKTEQKLTLSGLMDGSVDLVIGTHRLVQSDVHFKDLGLLIIDEEQRFGVEAKERLKKLRTQTDILTLSATPIPRTLHLSLIGVRDISNLETPPQDRMAIETRICRFDPTLIRQAIVRELNRGGQIYFVHNRVYNIQTMAERIRSIVPEAQVGVVHGQMNEHEMEEAMLGFVRGDLDVLVATTIIESGLDIPNANTIFINQAEHYGLAEMHQLRGRVGRYKHRAYCYLMVEEGKILSPQATKRLKAIEEFSELGAGFKISMRDLEIRGAGNILGTEQSGHIAIVGYELYCQLLENAVRALKREPLKEHRHVDVDLPISAFIPSEYVPPGRLKIEMYRKLSQVVSMEELRQYETEIKDRFGPVPKPAQRMIDLREIQLLASRWSIDRIHLEGGYCVFSYRLPRKIEKLAQETPFTLRVVDDRQAHLVLPRGYETGLKLLRLVRKVLDPAGEFAPRKGEDTAQVAAE
ncbi:transcription-repair coupling factor [Planctopirus limnophila DSM 3776]|uniref:Transcription-repair-coupling factor n=1 Tax=Planctopirus limnophila (strain ATCC 43296 / DSM 3776 / IFAM 1008 / Mu 290) TaxID=521674 RepID=D5SWE7_PLAL2|nr:transcription-repair coupling factor [Planctopirus limnophila]ADG69540.1 transcription-repair coupling factor [Planctopirus limnophila DSM 3776]